MTIVQFLRLFQVPSAFSVVSFGRKKMSADLSEGVGEC